MAIYLVEGPRGKALVETRTAKGAINHIAQKEYKATVVNGKDLVKHIKDGLEVEEVTDEVEAKKEAKTPEVKTPLGVRAA